MAARKETALICGDFWYVFKFNSSVIALELNLKIFIKNLTSIRAGSVNLQRCSVEYGGKDRVSWNYHGGLAVKLYAFPCNSSPLKIRLSFFVLLSSGTKSLLIFFYHLCFDLFKLTTFQLSNSIFDRPTMLACM